MIRSILASAILLLILQFNNTVLAGPDSDLGSLDEASIDKSFKSMDDEADEKDESDKYRGSHNALSASGKGTKLTTSEYSTITHASECYRVMSKKGNIFAPGKSAGEFNSFVNWARLNPSKVSIIDCVASCGDGYCEAAAGETAASCAADCRGSCGDGICHVSEDLTSCAIDCVSCGDKTCTSPSEDAVSCPTDCGSSSEHDGAFHMENDGAAALDASMAASAQAAADMAEAQAAADAAAAEASSGSSADTGGGGPDSGGSGGSDGGSES